MTTSRGKWSEAGVPHKGWTCVGVEDLEEPAQICEMCESMEIRYVHLMEHRDYPEILEVGCVCAEHMEDDYVGPRLRENKLKSLVRRRSSWARRQWRISAQGNSYVNAEGFNLTVFSTHDKKGSYWGLRVTNRANGISQYGRRRYQSKEAAKKAALDALLWAKDNLSI